MRTSGSADLQSSTVHTIPPTFLFYCTFFGSRRFLLRSIKHHVLFIERQLHLYCRFLLHSNPVDLCISKLIDMGRTLIIFLLQLPAHKQLPKWYGLTLTTNVFVAYLYQLITSLNISQSYLVSHIH